MVMKVGGASILVGLGPGISVFYKFPRRFSQVEPRTTGPESTQLVFGSRQALKSLQSQKREVHSLGGTLACSQGSPPGTAEDTMNPCHIRAT